MRELLSIGELAKLLNISAHTIRYYEKEGLIKPKINDENGYRFYGYEEMYQLATLMFFRDGEMSLKDIKSLTRSYSVEKYNDFLDQSLENTRHEIARLQSIEKRLMARIDKLSRDAENFEKFVIKKYKKRLFSVLKYTPYDSDYTLKELYDAFYENRIDTKYLYKDDINFIIQDDRVGYCIELDKPHKKLDTLLMEAGDYLTIRFKTENDSEVTAFVGKLFEELNNKGLRSEGEMMLIADADSGLHGDNKIYYELQVKIIK